MILRSVHEKLQSSRLDGRMSHSFEIAESERTYKKLDTSTVLHKMMENMLGKKRMLAYGRQKLDHETISLELGAGITESEIASALSHPPLQRELAKLLELIVRGKQIVSEKIPLPIDG